MRSDHIPTGIHINNFGHFCIESYGTKLTKTKLIGLILIEIIVSQLINLCCVQIHN